MLNSLSGRLLILTTVFVMVAEVLIFVPSIARFREDYMLQRLERAQIASLALLADDMLDPALEEELLRNAEVFNVVLRRDEARQLMLSTADAHGTRILPVDSEHSAIFQGLIGEDISAVERIIITASGGALRDWPLEKLAGATLDQASSHPNWDMGQRITIDSASMFNKAMEVIETHEFFDISPDQIEVLVHPQSMIHALVGFNDGALMAHIGPPDMRHAIGFALHHPDRTHLPVERLDLAKIGSFDFRAPDDIRWPALRLAREVMARGGMAGAVFNAAKEVALDGFIGGKLRFPQMAEIVEDTMEALFPDNGVIDAAITLDNVAQVDHLARQAAWAAITKRAG